MHVAAVFHCSFALFSELVLTTSNNILYVFSTKFYKTSTLIAFDSILASNWLKIFSENRFNTTEKVT